MVSRSPRCSQGGAFASLSMGVGSLQGVSTVLNNTHHTSKGSEAGVRAAGVGAAEGAGRPRGLEQLRVAAGHGAHLVGRRDQERRRGRGHHRRQRA